MTDDPRPDRKIDHVEQPCAAFDAEQALYSAVWSDQ